MAALPELKSSVLAPVAAFFEMIAIVAISFGISGYGAFVDMRMVWSSTLVKVLPRT